MSKFLDKKEQVIDFKLTPYGKHALSNGNLRPSFYAFFDDNVIYDISYVGINANEAQNDIQNRIKNETQYLEGQVLYQDVDTLPDPNSISITYDTDQSKIVKFLNNTTPTENEPRKDIFRLEQMIGDAFLEADTQNAPAWKIVTLQGEINSTSLVDSIFEKSGSAISTKPTKLNVIPQLNIDLNYRLKVKNNRNLSVSERELLNPEQQIQGVVLFNNGEYITIENDDLTFYAEELNTILLNDNFEVEVFEVTGSMIDLEDVLIRKDFTKDYMSLNGGLMTDEYFTNIEKPSSEPNNNNVEYFFQIFKDQSVSKSVACKGIETFNKDSYYIDIDFECDTKEQQAVYYDIYGPVTEPEICQ